MIHFPYRSVATVLGCLLTMALVPTLAYAGHRGGHGGGGRAGGMAHRGSFGGAGHMASFRAAPSFGGLRMAGYGSGWRGYRSAYLGYRSAYSFGYGGSGYGGFGYGGFGYPGFGYGFGYPGYGYGSAFLGAIYGLGLGLGPYGSAYNPYVPPTPWYDGPLAPAVYGPDPPAIVAASPPAPGRIEVILSDPEAEVLFDGKPTTLKGTRRVYPTPNLAPGRTYWYRIRANWTQDGRPVHEDRTIYVSAGETTVVNFRR